MSTGDYTPPLSVTHPALLVDGSDAAFRQLIYHMVLAFGQLDACREYFGWQLGLSGPQFVVLIGTAHRQGAHGVTIRELAEHVQIASTHVTTEVGRLTRKRLLRKTANREDGRSVRVSLTARGEQAMEKVAPILREVNDVLFRHVDRAEFLALAAFLARFAANGEAAVQLIARARASPLAGNGSRSPAPSPRRPPPRRTSGRAPRPRTR